VKDQADHVVLEGSVAPNHAQQVAVRGLSRPDREAFLWDLRLGLLEMGLDFQGIELPLERILVFRSVYVEPGVLKDTFFDRLESVRRGIAWLQFTFLQQLSSGSVPEKPGSDS
jgi:hypothetical protein